MKGILRIVNILVALALLLAYASTFVPPSKFSILALFGLTYPVWLLSNVLFVILYALSKKKKRVLISLVVLVVGFNIHGSFYRVAAGNDEKPESSDLSVMTYNVRSFDRFEYLEGEKTRAAIVNLIIDAEADVMCFQEFFYSGNEGSASTKNKILNNTGANGIHEMYTHHMNGDRHFGLATVSKYPIINKGEIPFDNDINNACIFTDVVVQNDTVRIFNAHLSSIRFKKADYQFIENINEDTLVKDNLIRIGEKLLLAYKKREVQTQKIIEEINKSPFPVVLCGDFNDSPVSYTYRKFSSVLDDTFRSQGSGLQSTYIGKFPSFRIDYVMSTPEYACTSFKTFQDKLSDHKAVQVTLNKID